LALDPGFQALCDGRVHSAKALGDLLRSFSKLNCRDFNTSMIDLAYQLHHELCGDRPITIDIDSTTNQQHSKKMEGACYNYAGCDHMGQQSKAGGPVDEGRGRRRLLRPDQQYVK
jgi:hypothetical protein